MTYQGTQQHWELPPADAESLVEGLTANMDANIYLAAAKRLGLGVEIVDKSMPVCRIFDDRKVLLLRYHVLGVNTYVARGISHDKFLTLHFCREHDVPVPDAQLLPVRYPDKIIEHVRKHRPVVLKPKSGSFSRGVTIDPRSDDEIRLAVEQIKAMGERSVQVETLIRGDDYRILFFRDEIVNIVKWISPYVVGNGLDPLQTLIATKNAWRARYKLPEMVVDPQLLENAGLTLYSIPDPGFRVILNAKTGYEFGGDTTRIPLVAVHPENLRMFQRAWRGLHLVMGGIDFISQDIAQPYYSNGAAINEVNAHPNIFEHFLADQHEDLHEAETILARHFFAEALPVSASQTSRGEGWIVVLNGASCAGKSTLAKAILELEDTPTLYLALDQLQGMLPRRYATPDWPLYKELTRTLAAAAHAASVEGVNVVIDTVLASRWRWLEMQAVLPDTHTYWVGVHAPLEQLLARVGQRGSGERDLVERQFKTVHQGARYDVEISTESTTPPQLAEQILEHVRRGELAREAAYKAEQGKMRESLVSIGRPLGNPEKPLRGRDWDALKGLRTLEFEDQWYFSRITRQHGVKDWLYYFPFLHAFARTQRRTLLWEVIDGSLCVYNLRNTLKGEVLTLYLSPLPCQEGALRQAMTRCRQYNENANLKILWVPESELALIPTSLRSNAKAMEVEYIYDRSRVLALDGAEFSVLRDTLDNVRGQHDLTCRPYVPTDLAECLPLVDRWYWNLAGDNTPRGGKLFPRIALESYADFDRTILRGEVLVRQGKIVALTLGGPLSGQVGSIFVAVTEETIPGLDYLQRYRFMENNPDLLYFNDSGDLGRADWSKLKDAFAPVERRSLYRVDLSL